MAQPSTGGPIEVSALLLPYLSPSIYFLFYVLNPCFFQVHTSFELRDIISIDDEKFTITFSKFSELQKRAVNIAGMYFGVRWKEPRLKNHDNSTM